ncbi:InlB B-repeat-containing protein [Paenibacillus sp. GSMTC-2017]|uniref:InlB B-repeat-containing protein n=1 Tax=Paenibacillus sp. GSMTC-2017 TaxID=2794350 RepID=UPI0018D87827|nr:InlB B-repeat-containing protein [Paenibacillus sp. GSMTC-2017]MBH5319380.1 InlB B-repeat-containing protein [Paenibacillus sp. GSMTC-2017]
MYNRLLSLLLSFCILLTLVPVEIFAAESPTISSSAINWHDQTQEIAVGAANGSDEQPTVPNSFEDVKPTDWFYPAVTYVQQNGLFSGTDKDSFSPGGTMTRAMYVTVLGRMARLDVSQYATTAFKDVQSTAWYAPYVGWAVDKGITSGTGNDTFSPNAPITREQMATLTLKYFEVYKIPYQTKVSLTSKPKDIANISPWAADAIVKLWQAGLLTGDAKGNFNPRSKATRAEAAMFSMRSNEVVKAGLEAEVNPNPTNPTTEPSKPTTGGGSQSTPPPSTTPSTYIITFETNGGSAITSLSLEQGKRLNNLPVPFKVGSIFQGWYKDRELTQVLLNDDVLGGNMTLYAKYIESVDEAVQSIPSITVLDQAPSLTIKVIDTTGSMTVDQVKAGMKFDSPANPQFAGIEVTGSNGQFTVAAAGGAFEEGNTYRLTLTDTNLSFAGQDQTTRIYIFSIAKQEVAELPLNADMIFVPFADISNMTRDGKLVGSTSIPVISASVGDSGTGLELADVTEGTFTYNGSTSIQVGDTVAMYEGIRPDQRTTDTSGTDSGDVAYVQITAKNGNKYTYTHADAKNVLLKPNVLPVSTAADTDGDTTNLSITVEHSTMNYQESKYAPLGLNDLTVVKTGDFIAFYNGEFGSESTSAGYGLITSITPVGEMDVIAYSDATQEQITGVLDFYQKQKIEGDQLLSEADVASMEGQIKQQAVESGFVQEAADYLSAVALQTETFKQRYDVKTLGASGDDGIDVSVENLTIVPSISNKLQHFPGYTGASVTLQVQCDIVINTDNGDPNNIVIHLTSTFVEEMRFELGVNGDTQIKWYWFIPVIKDYIITANLDAYTYTGITVTAEIGTIEKNKLVNWKEAKNVQNIAKEIQVLLDGVGSKGAVNADTLRNRYQSILEKETEWVPLLSKELVKRSQRVCLGIIEIEFVVNFVISLNPNLTVGIDFNYKSAKRYSVTVRVLSGSGSSDTVSLSGDGEYQFKLYVLGTLALRAGIQVELKAGILSVDLNSIGFEVEAGPYLKMWGYFYYQLTNSAAAGKQSKSLGALFIEMGIYLDSAFIAQVGDGWLSAEVPIYEKEWPLYSVGAQDNIYDFVYPQEDTLEFKFIGKATSVKLPDKLFTMNVMDLKTGETSEKVFDSSNFTVTVDNRDFEYDPSTKTLKVKNTNTLGSTGNLTITWKNAPLAFTSAQIKRTFSIYFSAALFDWGFQFYFNNGDMPLAIVAQYNAKITSPADPVRPGYKFAGWYDSNEGGSKYTIPERMPAIFKTLYARWTPNTDIPYTIEHYLVDPNDYAATLAATEHLKGTTDAEIKLTSSKYVDQGYAPSTVPKGVFIKANGSTVVKIYYYRASKKMTFKPGYGDLPAISVIEEQIGKTISSRIPVGIRPGYTFNGWSPSAPSTVPNQDTTYTAKWIAKDDTAYKVVHLQQDIARGTDGFPILGSTYSVVAEENMKGITDTATITASPKSYEGFTYDSSAPGTLLSSTIAGDGTTVLRLFYKRNTYSVTYDPNGAKFQKANEPNVRMIPYGAQIKAPVLTNTPGVQDGWMPRVGIMPAQALKLTAKWETAPYVVTHTRQALTGEYTITESETLEGLTFNEVIATPKSYEGFTYDNSIPGTVEKGIIRGPKDSPPQLKLYYKRNTYKVTFDANGGTGGTTTDVAYGASLASLSEPQVTKAGYIFKSWFPTRVSTMPAQNVTYTAQWENGPTVSSVGISNATPTVGDTLTADVVMSDSGLAGSRVTYQWQVETEAASGSYQNATGAGNTTTSYTVAAEDAGKKLQVIVTGVGEVSGSATSAATSAVPVPVTGVTINIVDPTIGDTLVATVTMGDGNAVGSRVTYQWKVETAAGSGSYQNATGAGNKTSNYTVASADVGKKLQVVVNGISPAIGTKTATTNSVVVKVMSVSINNVAPSVGDTLIAEAVMSDGNAAGSRVIFQWQVETVAGSGTYQNATGVGNKTASYTVAAVDAGKKLQVVVTGVTPAAGTQSVATSAVSVHLISVTINNSDPTVGNTVYATVTLDDGNPAGSRVTYQWQVEETAGSGTYQDATGTGSIAAAYIIPSIDAGKKLQVVVTGVSPAVGTLTSSATNAVLTSPTLSFMADAAAAGLTNVVQVSETEVSVSSTATLTGNLIIPAGVTLSVSGTFTVNAEKTLTVEGALKVTSQSFTNKGTVIIGSSGTVTLHGQVISNGTWINDGTVSIPVGGLLKSDAGSKISGAGITNVDGKFETYLATVSITGSIVISPSAQFVKNFLPMFGNFDTNIQLLKGASATVTYINGISVYTFSGRLMLMSTQFKVNANEQYVFASGSTFDINRNYSLTINAGGAVINNGTITNEGTITNNGTFDTTGGTLINNGTLQ